MQWLWLLFSKSGQIPPIRWRKAILVTDAQVKARPLVRIQVLPGRMFCCANCAIVATGKFLRTASGAGFPGPDG